MKLYELFADKDFHTSFVTSFGIDFDAYENIVLPRLRGAGCRNNIVVVDGRMLVHALDGGSPLPRFAGKSYTVIDAGARGVFHPKLFLQVGRHRGRLIISSANLTTPGLAGNLEIVGIVECTESDSGEQQLIAQAWAYLSRFIRRDQQGLTHQLDWMLARTPWLKTANPATQPVGLVDGTRAALLTTGEATGIGRSFAEFIDRPVSRLIAISPFWDTNLAALSYLAQRLSPGEVSVILDKSRTQFPKEALHGLNGVHLYDRGDFQKGRFVHAKVFIAQTEDADHVLFGSANCTAPALGVEGFAGANEEASLYRRLPAGLIVRSLQLETILTDAQRIEPDKLLDLPPDQDLAFDALSAQNGGRFESLADTLIWHPAAFNPDESMVELLDQRGKPMSCRLSPLHAVKNAVRFQISGTQDIPGFAQVRRRDGALSTPSIVTVIDHLRANIQETSSRPRENLQRQLDDETEATLLLMEAFAVLDPIERGERIVIEPLSIPKSRKDEEETAENHQILSYEQFVAGRRLRTQTQRPHNSLGGSDVSVIRATLNRIIGHAGYDPKEISAEDDDSVPDDIFDMADETADAAAALRAGEEFNAKISKRPEPTPDQVERQQIAKAKKASKDQILSAVARFNEHIGMRHKAGALDNHDMLRLRALLMVVCTAALPAAKKNPAVNKSRYQVLPAEGDNNAWPLVIGRVLFPIFGATKPAIAQLHLSAEHDQIPNDFLECWATIYWCVQACLTAPLSSAAHDRVAHWFKRIADRSYRLTLPTKEEMLDEEILKIMERMSASYCERVGGNPEAITKSHRRFVENLFKDSP